MADLVSPILDVLSRLWTCCALHTKYLCKLQENKVLLRTAMDELKGVRNDAKRRIDETEADLNEPKKRTDEADGWLQNVQIMEDQVEKMLQEADDPQLISRARCVGVCCPPNNCWRSYKLGKSIAKKIPSVNELKGKRQNFGDLTYPLPPPSVQHISGYSTVGMESMFHMVWRLITSKADQARVMGLYGIGGVGKTTLLKKINNEFNKSSSEHVPDHVLVIFVVVSKPVNYEAIQTKVGERLGLKDSLQGDGDESSRANKIFNKLKNKNFVILLDDIWERVDLTRIGIPSRDDLQSNSSKVIFTTRNKDVCGHMEATHNFQVDCLPWEKAWTLFQDKVGNETLHSHPEIPELAKLIAKECGGLPLVLITIGRAMSSRKIVQEWKDARTTLQKSASKFQGMSDEVLPRLKLSYDYLGDDNIKSCFLYCALYPEDYSIDIAKLIDIWIAEGYLNEFGNNLDEARNHGRYVIETLKRASLLENGEFEESQVKMHDIIRDLALWIVNDCKSSNIKMDKFLVASNNNISTCEGWKYAERIFWRIHSDDERVVELENPPTSPHLQTLIGRGKWNCFMELPQSFFQFTPFLRVLDFSSIRFTELPTSICELSNLQYLGLENSAIKELPVELRKLVKLKFLNLNNTFDLRKIPPRVIANLSELQALNLNHSGFKDWELNEEDGKGLSFCELDNLKQLQEVQLGINTSLALEKLLCNQKLRKICTCLELEDYVNLKSVSLSSSSSTTTISEGLWNLPSLKYLEIHYSLELEEITMFINENGDTNTTTTSSSGILCNNNKLEKLILDNLPRLNNIVWEKYHHHYMAAQQQQPYLHFVSPFQNLYLIIISRCDALKDLTWVAYVENLKFLWLESCEELETIIESGHNDGLEVTAEGGDQMLNVRGGGGGVFRRLITLSLEGLPKLKSISTHALAFPSIQTINVSDCPELKKLPLDSGSNINNTLKLIEGEHKWWDQLEWEDETIKSKFLPYYSQGYW